MSACGHARDGSALVLALWVLVILSVMVMGFAFEMRVELEITSYARKRMKAEALARGGVEYAKLLLAQRANTSEEDDVADEGRLTATLNLARGVPVQSLRRELGEGAVEISLIPEQGRRNVNHLEDEDWEELLDMANVPQDLWAELIDCFADWVDPGDEHRLNGAESDDAFYVERGYAVKNAPLDTVDELLLIKGFSESIVYGGPPIEKDGLPLLGLAPFLTTYGDARVNINTASREVLLTLSGMNELSVDAILEARLGEDGIAGTLDDGFASVDAAVGRVPEVDGVRDAVTTSEVSYLRVISIGEVHRVRYGVWCVMRVDSDEPMVVYWREEML